MKAILLALALCGFVAASAIADGYPFDPVTQQVNRDTLRIRLSKEQVESLSASGTLNLTDAQVALVRLFYPKALKARAVIAATFNDNNEGLSDEDVDVFWVAAEEIAVTLNPRVLANARLRDSALASAPVPHPSNIRIAPNGQIYIGGKRSSLRDAFELIAHRSSESGRDQPQANVCVAPPFRSVVSSWRDDPDGQSQEASTLDQSVADIFTKLVQYGKAHKVNVGKCW